MIQQVANSRDPQTRIKPRAFFPYTFEILNIGRKGRPISHTLLFAAAKHFAGSAAAKTVDRIGKRTFSYDYVIPDVWKVNREKEEC